MAPLVLLAGVCAVTPIPALAVQVPESQVKAAFLINFAKFVEWPDAPSRSGKPLVIGLLGRDATGVALVTMAAGKVVSGRPLVLRHFTTISEVSECDLLYVARTESRRLPAVVEALKGRHVLTVSDHPEFAREGGMIAFRSGNRRVSFEVNPVAARGNGLIISSQLLSVAVVVNGR